MDSEDCVDLCKESGDESIGTIEVNNDVPPKANKVVEATDCCLVPITPDSGRENGDFQSPLTLTVVRKQLKLACIDPERNASDNNNNGSPQTPKDGVFDPFAHGPDNMARAPHSNKCLDELRISVARQLNFHVVQQQNAESLSDEDMFESVYENILQVIVSNQTEGVSVQMSNVECGDSVDCKTPPSPPLQFTGIADTCPGAPKKPACKPRNIQAGLCKKLEF